MPAAGFYSIYTNKLSFRRDGRWYADDEPIVHQRLAALFSRYLRRKAAGGFEIWIDDRYHADVEVEDTPWVVTEVDIEPEGQLSVALNDNTVEQLLPSGLSVGDDDVLYCLVKGGNERARFLRPAYYQLAPFIEEAVGKYQLRCGNRLYPISRD